MTPTRNPECVECKAERIRRGLDYPKHPRPAPHPGPRCVSHHRQNKRSTGDKTHERRVRKIYGLKPGEYGNIYLAQNGRCAVCQWATGASKRLSVDHDHKTGLVRGLLCSPCNKFLGWVRDDPEAGKRIWNYLKNPPARQLGIVAIHEDNRKDGNGY